MLYYNLDKTAVAGLFSQDYVGRSVLLVCREIAFLLTVSCLAHFISKNRNGLNCTSIYDVLYGCGSPSIFFAYIFMINKTTVYTAFCESSNSSNLNLFVETSNKSC